MVRYLIFETPRELEQIQLDRALDAAAPAQLSARAQRGRTLAGRAAPRASLAPPAACAGRSASRRGSVRARCEGSQREARTHRSEGQPQQQQGRVQCKSGLYRSYLGG